MNSPIIGVAGDGTIADGERMRAERLRPSGLGVATGVLLVVTRVPAVASGHDPGGSTTESAVAFGVVVFLSVLVSFLVGLGVVTRQRARSSQTPTQPQWIVILVVALGVLGLTAGALERGRYAIVGGVAGVSLAWLVRNRALTDCGSCADTTFGAILTHRTVEGVLVAGVYTADAGLGLAAVVVLTGHAVAETVAVGGLYATAGRGWGLVGVTAPQLGFATGAAVGSVGASLVSPITSSLLVAGIGGVLLTSGLIELGRADGTVVPERMKLGES